MPSARDTNLMHDHEREERQIPGSASGRTALAQEQQKIHNGQQICGIQLPGLYLKLQNHTIKTVQLKMKRSAEWAMQNGCRKYDDSNVKKT